jgi:hypothetical protein
VAQSGNGIDIATIYQLLMQMSARLDQVLSVVNDHSGILNDHTRILGEHTRILNDHARQLDDLNAAVAGLRSDVTLYHEAVTSQGIHYSELEGRMLRAERHLRLDTTER